MSSKVCLWLPMFCMALQLVAGTSQPLLAIEPWTENPWYWSSNGQPVMLLGGSDDDNLFQWPAEKLLPQLERIASAGGNVIRNTMSDRHDHGFELYPFMRLENGRYDLSQWNDAYWERLERMLQETQRRKIFVQIEIWDRFDFTDSSKRQDGSGHWQHQPYNPANNSNYTAQESGLAERYPEHPGANKQPFFFTTPQQRNNTRLLAFQRAFVNRLLDCTLNYDHVLYCIDNETTGEAEWAEYWAQLLQRRAAERGTNIMITEMWDDWDLQAERHRRTFDHSELYSYVDVSQNNHNRGQKHWDNFLFVRNYLKSQPRPMNTTKTYGADGNKFKHTDQDGIERFWRHLLAGAASIRFHRPGSGLGINDKAVACIKAARMVESHVPLWGVDPANQLLSQRDDNEAYAASSADSSRALVFFPASQSKRQVQLQLAAGPSDYEIRWIGIDLDNQANGSEALARTVDGNPMTLVPPIAGNVVAVLKRIDDVAPSN